MNVNRLRIAQGAVMVACAAVGFGLSWWINEPEMPWLTLTNIHATYLPGGDSVKVTGRYLAQHDCRVIDPNRPNPLTWRQEVQGSKETPLIQYGVQPDPPNLRVGEHGFQQEIPLQKGILPDGWILWVLVTCDREFLPVRSLGAKVKFLPPLAASAGSR